ncbi:carbohydrate porin [Swingsia samuiensis]|uniref:Carbohydrate porin n=2 Tax=Swingsia samuiensis TaxID=1293412 RepID=A0A4Y6UNT2_9PROT|nr:carbohydrate porin [Swingsia samuiensis]
MDRLPIGNRQSGVRLKPLQGETFEAEKIKAMDDAEYHLYERKLYTVGSPVIRTQSQPDVLGVVKKNQAQQASLISDTTEKHFFPASFHDWLTQSTMTGDWGGLRTRLTDMGINIGGRFLQDTSGNPRGGKAKTTRYADEFGLNIDFDLKKLTGYKIGYIHFSSTSRQGLGIGAKLPALDSPQEIFGSGETVRLTRLSWEMKWNQYVATEVGEINTENDFEQGSTYWGMNAYCQFQSNAICGMPQSIAMNSGYGYYPTAHPGAWVKFYPAGNDHYLVQFGVYSVDPTISNTHNGWKMNLHGTTGTYLPFQLGWHQGGANDYSGPLQTNIKVGGYWDTSEVKDVYSQLGTFEVPQQYLVSAPSQKVRGRFGGWVQADRMLERDKRDPSRGTSVFGSFTWGDPRTSVAPYFITWGVTRKGTFASRPNDTFSIGMKMLWVNPKLTIWARQMQEAGAKGLYKPSGEHALEMNYGWRPTPWLMVRPGVQYIWNTGGTKKYNNPVILDLETGITF